MRRQQAPDDGGDNRADDNNGVAAEMRSIRSMRLRPFLAKYKTPDGVIKTDGKQGGKEGEQPRGPIDPTES
jgi:hypothetical protein